ncbi:hypothetical protein Tco_0257432 [Tanacetum coccineum]
MISWKGVQRASTHVGTGESSTIVLQNLPYTYQWAEKKVPVAEGIDNDIYSTVDACPNACEMWKGKTIEVLTSTTTRMAKVLRLCRSLGFNVITARNMGMYQEWSRNYKRVKDAAYLKEKMLLCNKREAVVQLNAEQLIGRMI